MKKNNQQQLIKHLSNKKDWISADELASYLHVSSRTIRNYILEINSNHQKQPLILSSKSGYLLNPNATSSGAFYKTEVLLPKTPYERHYYIVRKLLNRHKLSINELTDALCISERTLEMDILELSSLIKKHNLKIRRNKDYILLKGDEFDKRKLCIYAIKNTENSRLSSLNFIKYIFPEFDVATICSISKKHIHINGLNINGFIFYDFLLMLMIQIFRMQSGNYVENIPISLDNIQQYPDYQAALGIKKDLENQYAFHFNNKELYFLCIALICTTDYSKTSPLLDTASFKITYNKFHNTLKLAESHFNCSLLQEEFLLKLTHHFQRIQLRSIFNLFSYNPVFFDIRNKHPFLYEVATHIADGIQNNEAASINEEEINFIAFQLGLFLKQQSAFDSRISGVFICPSYYNIADAIIDEIMSHTNNQLDIEEIYDTLDIEHLADPSYSSKLIFSVLPIENLPNALIISPFLSSSDFNIINNKIYSLKRKMYLQEFKRYIDMYLPKNFFEINHYFSSREQAIHYLCNKLAENDFVDRDYELNVLKRENMSSTSFFNIVALPHSAMLNAKKSSIQIIINNKPMLWNDEQINIIVMIALSSSDSYNFHIIYDLAARIFSDSKITKPILMVKDFKSFLDIFQRVI